MPSSGRAEKQSECDAAEASFRSPARFKALSRAWPFASSWSRSLRTSLRTRNEQIIVTCDAAPRSRRPVVLADLRRLLLNARSRRCAVPPKTLTNKGSRILTGSTDDDTRILETERLALFSFYTVHEGRLRAVPACTATAGPSCCERRRGGPASPVGLDVLGRSRIGAACLDPYAAIHHPGRRPGLPSLRSTTTRSKPGPPAARSPQELPHGGSHVLGRSDLLKAQPALTRRGSSCEDGPERLLGASL